MASKIKFVQPCPTTVDFEAFKIQGRPVYPPIPVGVSIKEWGKPAKYYGWGHLTGNNSTWAEARGALAKAYDCPDGVLFQNGKFDVDVAEEHMGLEMPNWDKIHDTLFLLFLDDPHQPKLDLKSAANRLLGEPPEERDVVVDWLVERQPVPGIKISKSPKSDNYAMGYLPFAPGALVGKYANGDSDRTEKLFKLLYKKTHAREMLKAYDRERQLMPILLEMERQGLPVDVVRLASDIKLYRETTAKIDAWIAKTLKVKTSAEFNIDSGEQLINAAIAAGKADEALIPLTPTGKLQTNKEALAAGLTDPTLTAVLKYRAQLKTCLNTFMEPWYETAKKSGGLIYTTWNQTRTPSGGELVGTRTGRLSSTPNFQNIPKKFDPIFKHEEKDPAKAKKLAKAPFDLPPLPKVRMYIIPFDGDVFVDRDYSQQELRILAHFDGGQMMESYLDDPWLDFHDKTKDELAKQGRIYERKPVKNTNFGLIYGMGVGKMAVKNDTTVLEAKGLKESILNLYPGLKTLYKDMKLRADNNLPIRTWGGREYYCEPPKLIEGRMRTFDYKLVNVLVQGSAADCTKEAVIRFSQRKKELGKDKTWRVVLNVHDQLTASVPKDEKSWAMEVMRQAMESIEFDVPMLTEGSTSEKSWGELIDYDKKGELV